MPKHVYTFFDLILYVKSGCLKFPYGKIDNSEANRNWLGVMASKSSILSLSGVSERCLITDSTSHKRVVNGSSLKSWIFTKILIWYNYS